MHSFLHQVLDFIPNLVAQTFSKYAQGEVEQAEGQHWRGEATLILFYFKVNLTKSYRCKSSWGETRIFDLTEQILGFGYIMPAEISNLKLIIEEMFHH